MSAKSIPTTPITLYASAARTATPSATSVNRIQGNYRGLLVQIDCTAVTATPSVTFTVQDASPDDWTTVLASAAVTAVGTTNLICHPDAVDRANLSENTAMRSKWRLIATHADADSITYSVKAWLLA